MKNKAIKQLSEMRKKLKIAPNEIDVAAFCNFSTLDFERYGEDGNVTLSVIKEYAKAFKCKIRLTVDPNQEQ